MQRVWQTAVMLAVLAGLAIGCSDSKSTKVSSTTASTPAKGGDSQGMSPASKAPD